MILAENHPQYLTPLLATLIPYSIFISFHRSNVFLDLFPIYYHINDLFCVYPLKVNDLFPIYCHINDLFCVYHLKVNDLLLHCQNQLISFAPFSHVPPFPPRISRKLYLLLVRLWVLLHLFDLQLPQTFLDEIQSLGFLNRTFL